MLRADCPCFKTALEANTRGSKTRRGLFPVESEGLPPIGELSELFERDSPTCLKSFCFLVAQSFVCLQPLLVHFNQDGNIYVDIVVDSNF